MEQKGEHREIYHIGNDFEVSILELIKTIENTIGESIEVFHGASAEGGTARRCPDISKMRKLGYQPKIDLVEGLQRTSSWYSQQQGGLDHNRLL